MSKNHIIIMAGGVGSRLFPLSTPEHPKQFIDLLEVGRTLIQLTYERFLAVDPKAEFWVVTSKDYVHFVREQVPSIPEAHILAEPVGRNTAPCISYASRKVHHEDPDANIVVTPADAFVPDVNSFATTIKEALSYTAEKQAIVCIGIKPTRPHTGYGYIKAAKSEKITKIKEFKEKPDEQTARRYLEEGIYSWNAGIFVWNVKTIESQLRKYAPQIETVMDELERSFCTEREEEKLERLFPTCEKISIDYAVMEKTDIANVIQASWDWSDLGSFESIKEIKEKLK